MISIQFEENDQKIPHLVYSSLSLNKMELPCLSSKSIHIFNNHLLLLRPSSRLYKENRAVETVELQYYKGRHHAASHHTQEVFRKQERLVAEGLDFCATMKSNRRLK